MTTETENLKVHCFFQAFDHAQYVILPTKDNEFILQSDTWKGMTVADIEQQLKEYVDRCNWGIPESISTSEINSAIAECMSDFTQAEVDAFLRSIEFPEDAEGADPEEPNYDDWELFFYFYLVWTPEGQEDE